VAASTFGAQPPQQNGARAAFDDRVQGEADQRDGAGGNPGGEAHHRLQEVPRHGEYLEAHALADELAA
jgi:hypothetical protein